LEPYGRADVPRFFFHIDDHIHEIDEEGQDLSSAAEARVQAIIFAGSLLRDEPNLVWDGHQFEVRVTDEAGKPVTAVRVSAVDAVPD
jgi:hypothetical protein